MTGIYYADLFVINGKGCVVMGCGKSQTCRSYTGETTKEVMTDSLRFDVEGNSLVAYGDAGMGLLPFDSQRCPKIFVDYFIYMQAKDETGFREIQEISNNEFCEMADFNIIFNICNEEERRAEFKDLLADRDLKFISVPWGDSMETKGAMIKAYVK